MLDRKDQSLYYAGALFNYFLMGKIARSNR